MGWYRARALGFELTDGNVSEATAPPHPAPPLSFQLPPCPALPGPAPPHPATPPRTRGAEAAGAQHGKENRGPAERNGKGRSEITMRNKNEEQSIQ